MKNLLFLLLGLFAVAFGFAAESVEVFNTPGDVYAAAGAVGLIAGTRERSVIQALRSLAGVSVEKSYLQSEAVISNNKSEYNFQFRTNGNPNVTPHTRFLDQSDVFVSILLQLGLRENDSTMPEQLKNGHIQTYVNAGYFTANAGFTVADVNQVYAGNLEFKVANHLYFQYLNTQEFLYIPETQFDSTAGTFDSINAAEDGKIVPPQMAILSGDEDSNIKATFEVFAGIQWAATAANKSNVIVLKHDGLLIRGGAAHKSQIQQILSTVG